MGSKPFRVDDDQEVLELEERYVSIPTYCKDRRSLALLLAAFRMSCSEKEFRNVPCITVKQAANLWIVLASSTSYFASLCRILHAKARKQYAHHTLWTHRARISSML